MHQKGDDRPKRRLPDATCETTYVTLVLLSEGPDPSTVSGALHVEPTDQWRRGDQRHGVPARRNGWLLSSQDAVESRDVRGHMTWVLDQVPDDPTAFDEFRRGGWTTTVSCYWLSASGHGGPMLDPAQTRKLAALELPILFDVYFTR